MVKRKTSKKKSPHMTVGRVYWQRASGAYRLYEVVNSSGGTRLLSDRLTKKETRIFAQGWNAGSPRRKRIRGA